MRCSLVGAAVRLVPSVSIGPRCRQATGARRIIRPAVRPCGIPRHLGWCLDRSRAPPGPPTIADHTVRSCREPQTRVFRGMWPPTILEAKEPLINQSARSELALINQDQRLPRPARAQIPVLSRRAPARRRAAHGNPAIRSNSDRRQGPAHHEPRRLPAATDAGAKATPKPAAKGAAKAGAVQSPSTLAESTPDLQPHGANSHKRYYGTSIPRSEDQGIPNQSSILEIHRRAGTVSLRPS